MNFVLFKFISFGGILLSLCLTMTTVCLKPKTSSGVEAWPNIFSTFNTEAKSCLFMKQLTTTCISTILYLRKIFPDEYFDSKSLEGMSLKLLKFKKGYMFVDKIEKWLEGAFEAIDKKYLKHIMLDIKDAQTKMTLEIYTMTFLYQKGNEAPNILLSASESATSNFSHGLSNTQMKTIKLLQMCYAVTQSCTNLPRQVTLSMRLSYYEGTPQDYQPIGYKAWEPTHLQFPKDPRSVEIGVTGTNHHWFKLVNKSCLNDKFFKFMENQNLQKNYSSSDRTCKELTVFQKKPQTKAKKELQFDNFNLGSNSDFIPSSLPQSSQTERKALAHHTSFLLSNMDKTYGLSEDLKENLLPSTETNSFETEGKVIRVQCPCLSEKRSNAMFSCLNCQNLVHAECFGVLGLVHGKKIKFHCHLCYKENSTLKCHDRVMISLTNSSDQQKLAILRRVLKFCSSLQATKFNLKTIEKMTDLSCPRKVMEIVLNKMVDIGVVVPCRKWKNYSINKKELGDKLCHYFYQLQLFDSSQRKVIPIPARTPELTKRKTSDFNEFLDNKKFRASSVSSQTYDIISN